MDLNNVVAYAYAVHAFYAVVKADKRLHSSHVGLFAALLFVRYSEHTTEEFMITRKQLMQLSRIGSIATYQKCVYELVKYGYIEYKPTYNSYVGTKVRLIFLSGCCRDHHHHW